VKGLAGLGCVLAAVVGVIAAPIAARPAANQCRPTAQDAFGPFGRGIPPIRSKIGTGHVLTGVVISALDCRPIRRAQVQFWQSNANGVYTRKGSATAITDRDGRFRFEGPFPPEYEGLPPHIHIRVVARDYVTLLARYVPRPGEKRGTVRLVLVPQAV
jgi:protocatechuate 3,4-dioxygenase beta subunit